MKRQFLFAAMLGASPLLASSAALAAQEPPGSLAAMALGDAVAEFDLVCLSIHPNANRFSYALDRSDYAYRNTGGAVWRSPKTVVSRDVDAGVTHQCNFDALLGSDDAGRERIASAVEAGLRKELGLRPVRVVYEQGMRWDWTMDGKTHSVSYYFGPTIPGRQLALTYRVGG
ncbi:hypothetical protein [Sphingopyxis panaciterrae]